VDEFAELFSITRLLPEHREYHTLAGFVLEIAGAIPRTGEVFNWEGFRFEIVDMDGNRIDKVIVKPPVAAAPEEAPSI
jgi:putative hemolysin